MAIHDTVTKIAAKIEKDHLSYDAEARNLKTSGDVIGTTLDVLKEEGIVDLSKKQLDDASKALDFFVSSTALATGEASLGVFKKHKDVDSTNVEYDFAKGIKVNQAVRREFEASAPPRDGEERKVTTRYLRADAKITVKSVSSKSQTGMLAVRDHLYEMGQKELGPKEEEKK